MAIAYPPAPVRASETDEIEYPNSDGELIADNTLQAEWIVLLKTNIEALFSSHADVFVAMDLLWYPVKGSNTTRYAPDVLVTFGRPKGYRGSYRQWDEAGIAPQVVFEILSPGNRPAEMRRKLAFYERYGVEEYYVYNPDTFLLEIYERASDDSLGKVLLVDGYVSPRLQIRFVVPGNGPMQVFHPNGEIFTGYTAMMQERDSERQRADAEAERAAKLAEKMRALGLDPDAL